MLIAWHGLPISTIFAVMLLVVAVIILAFPQRFVGNARCFLSVGPRCTKDLQARLLAAMDRYDSESTPAEQYAYVLAGILGLLAALSFWRVLNPQLAVVLAVLASAAVQAWALLLTRREPAKRLALLFQRPLFTRVSTGDMLAGLLMIILWTAWDFIVLPNSRGWLSVNTLIALMFFLFSIVGASAGSAIGSTDPVVERMVDDRVRGGRAKMLITIAVFLALAPQMISGSVNVMPLFERGLFTIAMIATIAVGFRSASPISQRDIEMLSISSLPS